MSTLSTHVLDTSTGEPAVGVVVHLASGDGQSWEVLISTETDADGRASGFGNLESGTYRLGFETGDHGNEFYPFIHVVFEVDAGRAHYHIPLLLSAYGYTTYRGS